MAQHPAAAPAFDDDSAPADWRPAMVALRKPAEEVPLALFQFVRFFPLPPREEQAREEHPAPAPPEDSEPKVSANLLRRNARHALRGGDRASARKDLVEALRLEPFHLKAYMRLIRTFLP
jgi:hypothetical protein